MMESCPPIASEVFSSENVLDIHPLHRVISTSPSSETQWLRSTIASLHVSLFLPRRRSQCLQNLPGPLCCLRDIVFARIAVYRSHTREMLPGFRQTMDGVD